MYNVSGRLIKFLHVPRLLIQRTLHKACVFDNQINTYYLGCPKPRTARAEPRHGDQGVGGPGHPGQQQGHAREPRQPPRERGEDQPPGEGAGRAAAAAEAD